MYIDITFVTLPGFARVPKKNTVMFRVMFQCDSRKMLLDHTTREKPRVTKVTVMEKTLLSNLTILYGKTPEKRGIAVKGCYE